MCQLFKNSEQPTELVFMFQGRGKNIFPNLEPENNFYVTELEVNLNSRSRDCIFLLRYKSGKFIQDIYTGFYIKPLCTQNKFIPALVLTCQIFSKLRIVNHQENSIKIIPL